jgi:hypothetical protein
MARNLAGPLGSVLADKLRRQLPFLEAQHRAECAKISRNNRCVTQQTQQSLR